jgi:hypothetical protein
MNTLLPFRYRREFNAERGRHGEGSNCHGRNGEDLVMAGAATLDSPLRRTKPRAGPIPAGRENTGVSAYN